MIENRKFIRLKAPIGVVYKVLKNKSRRHKETPSLVRDIGGGGICITAKDDLREGDLLKIQIQIPHLKEPIEAIGEVIWFSPGQSERAPREAGVRFRDITTQHMHQILEYVYTIGIG